MIPTQQQIPGPIPELVACKVNAPCVCQCWYAAVQQVFRVWAEILHPVHVKLEVDPRVAQGPLVQLFAHVQGLTGGIEVDEVLYVS